MNTEITLKDVLELLFAAAAILVTYYFADQVAKIERRNSERADDASKPVLNFVVSEQDWKLMNVGGGTANQVRFCELESGDEWMKAIMNYSIPSGCLLVLKGTVANLPPVILHARALAAVYLDGESRRYLVVCRGDTNTVWEEGDSGWNQTLYDHHHDGPGRRGDLKLIKL